MNKEIIIGTPACWQAFILSLMFFAEETASAQAGALYKPMAKLSATVMEQKVKTELAAPKTVCIILVLWNCDHLFNKHFD